MAFVAAGLISTILLFLSMQACTTVVDSLADAYPNILILYTDDLGYGDVGCYNPESKIATPHIDRLASNGMLFTDANSPASICTPSRYSLMTGRHPWRRIDRIVLPLGPSLIGEDEQTVPKLLKEKGYQKALIGKWHLGWDWIWQGGVRPPEDQITWGGNSLVTADLLDFGQPVTGGAMGAGFDYYFGQDVPNFPPYA
jgi:arylsulfatase A